MPLYRITYKDRKGDQKDPEALLEAEIEAETEERALDLWSENYCGDEIIDAMESTKISIDKGDVIESVQDVGPYVVIAINEGGDMSTFTHARQDCLAMMLMEFFDKHPDIYDTMWQMKVAAQLGQLAKIDLYLGAETATEVQQLINSGNLESEIAAKVDELFDMLSRLARGEASEGEGSSMDDELREMMRMFQSDDATINDLYMVVAGDAVLELGEITWNRPRSASHQLTVTPRMRRRK